jgi:hypothetical protein
MDDNRVSRTDIENDFLKIFEKYPKSVEKVIFICFELILECFIVMLGEKKTIKLLEQSKKSIRGGKYTQKSIKPRKTRKKQSK